jgi:hypothetical protein
MNKSGVIVDYSTLVDRGARPMTGVVFVELNGSPFPARGWNDFPLVFLDAWARGLLRLLRNESRSERVYFMEGPYCIDLVLTENRMVAVSALKRPDQKTLSSSVSLLSLILNATEVSKGILSALGSKKNYSKDLNSLSETINHILAENR